MNRNQLKLIACISMLIDHIGYFIFPGVIIFRLIGRIAFPIFAFFISEGCLHTRNRKKYFLRVFILGILCQTVYIAESLITKSSGATYFNILLTFSLSIILCYSFLDAKNALKSDNNTYKVTGIIKFLFTLAIIILIYVFCENSSKIVGINIDFDYGIYGFMLPFFALISDRKEIKLLMFSIANTVFAFSFYSDIRLTLCSLIPVLLLIFYNGKSGKANLKYFFYAFYPCHLALVYIIDLIL